MKERIIGAVVLVVFMVLVVPVFLDGPSDDGAIISERVPLPGQAGQEESRTIVLERDRKQPVPVATAVQPARDDGEPAAAANAQKPVREEPKQQAPAPDPVPQPPVDAAAASSSTGMWAVQLGSFGNEENAERLAADLRKQGYAAFLSELTTSSGKLHRVRIGPQKDRESAEAMAAKLKKAGHDGQVVPHP